MKHWSNKSVCNQLPESNDFWMKMVNYDKYVVIGNINNQILYLRRYTNDEFRFIPNSRYATRYTLKTAEKYLRYLRTGMENVMLLANTQNDESTIRFMRDNDSTQMH